MSMRTRMPMTIAPWLALIAAATLMATCTETVMAVPERFAVACTAPNAAACTMRPHDADGWTARATVDTDAYNATGWGRLYVEVPDGSTTKTMDEILAFSAGYLEGATTTDMISYTYQNLGTPLDEKTQAFVDANLNWTMKMIASNYQTDAYWHQVGLIFSQLQGMVAGYQAHKTSSNLDLPFEKFLMLNLLVDLWTIEVIVHPEKRPDYAKMSPQEFADYFHKATHCSAIVKVTDDLSDLFFSHTTWCPYAQMLRLFKVYNLPYSTVSETKSSQVMFSGYPGLLEGVDDFYITSNQVAIMETTNGVFNNSLFNAVTPDTILPYWVRVIVASRMTDDAKTWHDVFYKYNSGTYNNQWMTVDYKLFTPGQPLPNNLFWVSEQLPGMYVSADQTQQLQRNYWPSYNVPYYQEIYNISGYPAQVAAHGVNQSYQLAPRAKIFRRDAGAIEAISDLQTFIRMNHYGQGDPLAPTTDSAIAARRDLDTAHPRADGAIDAKITNAAMIKNMTVLAIAGPTHSTQKPFSWTGYWSDEAHGKHFGHAPYFDFDWQTMTLRDMQ